jgi:branched-chain amino acid transport system permease protein
VAEGTIVPPFEDKQLYVYERFGAKIRAELKALITEELIQEHRTSIYARRSDALERVLNYFRRAPMPGKYILIALKPWEEYAIAVCSGVRGEGPRILDDERFATEEEGLHGIFLRRVRDLLAS